MERRGLQNSALVLTIWLQPKLACHKTIAFIRLIYHGGKLNLLLPV